MTKSTRKTNPLCTKMTLRNGVLQIWSFCKQSQYNIISCLQKIKDLMTGSNNISNNIQTYTLNSLHHDHSEVNFGSLNSYSFSLLVHLSLEQLMCTFFLITRKLRSQWGSSKKLLNLFKSKLFSLIYININKNCNKTMKTILLLKHFYSQSCISTTPEKTLYSGGIYM